MFVQIARPDVAHVCACLSGYLHVTELLSVDLPGSLHQQPHPHLGVEIPEDLEDPSLWSGTLPCAQEPPRLGFHPAPSLSRTS